MRISILARVAIGCDAENGMRFVIAIAVLVGCTKDDPGPRSPPPSNGIEVLSAGGTPARLLRYHLAKGTTSKLELAMQLDLVAGGRGGKLPTIAVALDIAIVDTLPTGDARLETTVTGVRVLERAGAVVPVSAVAPLAKQMAGIKYTAVLSADGQLRDVAVTNVPSGLEQQVTQLTQGLEQVTVRLPAMPVGVGAKWTSRRTARSELAMTMTTVTTIEVTAIDGDRVSFSSTSTITAPDQTITDKGMQAAFKDIGGAGSGRGTVDLATMTMHGELAMELRGTMTSAGQTSPLQMAMTLTLSAGDR